MPPLRERREDMPVIARALPRAPRAASRACRRRSCRRDALDELCALRFPGQRARAREPAAARGRAVGRRRAHGRPRPTGRPRRQPAQADDPGTPSGAAGEPRPGERRPTALPRPAGTSTTWSARHPRRRSSKTGFNRTAAAKLPRPYACGRCATACSAWRSQRRLGASIAMTRRGDDRAGRRLVRFARAASPNFGPRPATRGRPARAALDQPAAGRSTAATRSSSFSPTALDRTRTRTSRKSAGSRFLRTSSSGATASCCSSCRRRAAPGTPAPRAGAGASDCNDFSIGIELEGCEGAPFEPSAVRDAGRAVRSARARYPLRRVAGHEHIAPGPQDRPRRAASTGRACYRLASPTRLGVTASHSHELASRCPLVHGPHILGPTAISSAAPPHEPLDIGVPCTCARYLVPPLARNKSSAQLATRCSQASISAHQIVRA